MNSTVCKYSELAQLLSTYFQGQASLTGRTVACIFQRNSVYSSWVFPLVILSVFLALHSVAFSQSTDPTISERVADLFQEVQIATGELEATQKTVTMEFYTKWGMLKLRESIMTTLPNEISQLRTKLESEVLISSAYADAVAKQKHELTSLVYADAVAKRMHEAWVNKKILQELVNSNPQMVELRQTLETNTYNVQLMIANAPALVADDKRVRQAKSKIATLTIRYKAALNDLQRLKAQQQEMEKQTQVLQDHKQEMEKQTQVLQEQKQEMERANRRGEWEAFQRSLNR